MNRDKLITDFLRFIGIEENRITKQVVIGMYTIPVHALLRIIVPTLIERGYSYRKIALKYGIKKGRVEYAAKSVRNRTAKQTF